MSKDRIYEVPSYGRWDGPIQVIDEAGHPDSYRLNAVCMNCKWDGQLRIARGTSARRHGLGYECPACGCRTVKAGKLAGHDSFDNDSRDHMEKYREAQKKVMERILNEPRGPITPRRSPFRR